MTGFDRVSRSQSHDGYHEVVGDFLDVDVVERAVRNADAVLHLGAMMSWLPADAPGLFAANASGTMNLLVSAARARVNRFVFASSGEVYPEVRARYSPIDESHPREPVSAYGLSKLAGEDAVEFFRRTQNLATVILRFAHTQDAAELLDPSSFFSGPRFYLRSKIRQQRAFGNERALAALVPHDDGTEKLLLQCAEDDRPYRMMIADTRDIADGVIAALDSERAVGETMNLGPDAPVRFDEAVARLAEATHLPVASVRMPGPAVDYVTSNRRAREILGYRPR